VMDDTLYAELVAAIGNRPHRLRALCLDRGVPEALLDAIEVYWRAAEAHADRQMEGVMAEWDMIAEVQGLMIIGGLEVQNSVWECSCWFREANGQPCSRGMQWLLHHFAPRDQPVVDAWFREAIAQGAKDVRAVVAAVERRAANAPQSQCTLGHWPRLPVRNIPGVTPTRSWSCGRSTDEA
jgi:hypothetical protein